MYQICFPTTPSPGTETVPSLRYAHQYRDRAASERGFLVSAFLLLRPEHITHTGAPIECATQNEQQVGKPVEVLAHELGNRLVVTQTDDTAFDAATYRACEVSQRRSTGAAREDEVL